MNISYEDMPVVLRRRLEALKPTPGYCVFIKIRNLAGPGGEGLVERENTFQNIMCLLAPWCRLIKHPRGAYIFIIPEEQLINVGPGGYTALSFFDALQMIVRGGAGCLPAKAVVFSTNVSIVLVEERGQIIIQGDDIDPASCLINDVDNVENGQIVMNGAFYYKVRGEYDSIGNRQQFRCVEEISECEAEIEGYERPVTMYKFPRDANV